MATVLLIGDGAANRLPVELSSLGHSLLEATGDREGAQVALSRSVDVVLVDLESSKVSDEGTLALIREVDNQVPILLLASRARLQTMLHWIRRGAFGVLVEPVSKERLVRELDQALEFHRLVRQKIYLEQQLRPYREEVRRIAATLMESSGERTLSLLGCRLDLNSNDPAGTLVESLFDRVERVVQEEGGDLFQFVGNELLAVFRCRPTKRSHGLQALRAAFRVRQVAGGKAALAVHAGPVALVNGVADVAGADDLVVNTFLLLTMNPASGILLSESLYRCAEERLLTRRYGQIPVRCSVRETGVYQMLDMTID